MHNPVHFISRIANCNSSSSHALVEPEASVPLHRDMTYFGRCEATKVVDKKAKMAYLNAQVNGAGSEVLIRAFMQKFPKWKYNPSSEIDHQSQLRCPKDAYYAQDRPEIILQLFDLILQDDVEILVVGDEYPETVPSKVKVHPLQQVFYALTEHDMLVNQHSDYGWVLYGDMDAGGDERKFVLKMRPDAETFPYTCDMKITEMCWHECAWCYQNSNHRGAHAKFEDVVRFVEEHPHIIEYALGGGEPTLHPDFDRIVKFLRSRGKRANFTTRNFEYFHKHVAHPNFTGVALSAKSWWAVIYCSGVLSTLAQETKNVARHIHLIAWPDDMVELLKNIDDVSSAIAWRSRLVLLAPKLKTNPKAKAYWEKSLKKAGGRKIYDETMAKILGHTMLRFSLSVDTPLMRDYKEFIDFDPMYHFETEGEFSMYHDAITGKSYKSSYELDEELK